MFEIKNLHLDLSFDRKGRFRCECSRACWVRRLLRLLEKKERRLTHTCKREVTLARNLMRMSWSRGILFFETFNLSLVVCLPTNNWCQLQGVSRLRLAAFEVTSSAQIQRTVRSILSSMNYTRFIWFLRKYSCSLHLSLSFASRFNTSPRPAIDFASRGDKRQLLRRQSIPWLPILDEFFFSFLKYKLS